MKPFGKLSPNDKLSASLMPMLYDRPHKVLEKLRNAIEGEQPAEKIDTKVQERMDMGNILEEEIIKLVAARLDISIRYPIEEVMSVEIGMASDRSPLDIYASLDGIFYASKPKIIIPEDRKIYTADNEQLTLLGPVPVEVKNMQYKPYNSIECMTVDYGRGYLQLQTQMMVAEADFGIIGCLFNGNDMRVFVVKADGEIQNTILSKALILYQHLEEGSNYTPHDLDTMAGKFSEIKKPNIELPAGLLDIANKYEEQLTQRKEIDVDIERLQMKMVEALGESEMGTINHNGGVTRFSRPIRHYKAQPAKYIEAKEARDIRAKAVSIKHLLDEWN
jgi:hypothetical protein|tara:strand:+ start:6494 stop:7492 length:999 start_codon:yes stop_codon:yes gene_type:complete